MNRKGSAAGVLVERGALAAIVCEAHVVDERLQKVEEHFLEVDRAAVLFEGVLGWERRADSWAVFIRGKN